MSTKRQLIVHKRIVEIAREATMVKMELIEVTLSNVDVLSLLKRIKLIVCYLIVKVFIK